MTPPTTLISFFLLITSVKSFTSPPSCSSFQSSRRFAPHRLTLNAKGFGSVPEPPPPKPKSSGAVDRERQSEQYDKVAAAGGQQYSVFVRKFGEDADGWLACGSVSVMRGTQVSEAIYANEDRLKGSLVREFPSLKEAVDEIEFGFRLKVYPDDEVEVAIKDTTNRVDKLNPINWLSTLLSPVDNSKPKE